MGVANPDPRFAVAGLDNRADRLVVRWGDGHESRFHAVWLRHACQCERCGAYASGIRSLRLTDIPDDIGIARARADGDGGIETVWRGDGHVSVYAAEWLRGNCNSESERARRRRAPILWGKEIEGRAPEADYAACKTDGAARLAMLEALRDRGFVLVRGAPVEPETTGEVAALAGPLRVTNYGSVYDFRYTPDATIYGDLNVHLDPHTDEAYRQVPPAITCFHFIRAARTGGESTVTDGFRIAAMLREEDPAAFRLLATLPVTHHRRLEEQDRDFRMRAPVLGLDGDGAVAGVRCLDRAIGPVEAPDDAIPPFYRALRRFQAMLFDPENQVRIPVAGGEALFFDNRRVLHGRHAFPPDGERYMRTCHVEIDEFDSSLRTLTARLAPEAAAPHRGAPS